MDDIHAFDPQRVEKSARQSNKRAGVLMRRTCRRNVGQHSGFLDPIASGSRPAPRCAQPLDSGTLSLSFGEGPWRHRRIQFDIVLLRPLAARPLAAQIYGATGSRQRVESTDGVVNSSGVRDVVVGREHVAPIVSAPPQHMKRLWSSLTERLDDQIWLSGLLSFIYRFDGPSNCLHVPSNFRAGRPASLFAVERRSAAHEITEEEEVGIWRQFRVFRKLLNCRVGKCLVVGHVTVARTQQRYPPSAHNIAPRRP